MKRGPVHCAAQGCPEHVNPGQLMCKSHWFSLPKALRDEVWRTYRRWAQVWTGRILQDDQRQRAADYREAVRAATDYLRTVPKSPAEVASTIAVDADGGTHELRDGRLL